jgi:ubiquinone/menaquinone biosynthesis C-methylase UbiE
MKKRVSDFFDTYAADFNAIYGSKNSFLNNLINRHLRKAMMFRFIKTIEGCCPLEGKKIIDIGCGSGHYAVTLAKKGAASVYGIDFAKGMIDLAKKSAGQAGVNDKCAFDLVDFTADPIPGQFDYAVVMGFMDYIKEPRPVIEKVLSITKLKAFFSFPAVGGILALQRKLRYKNRCDLFFYDKGKICDLFKGMSYKDLKIEKIDRDFFVTVSMQ